MTNDLLWSGLSLVTPLQARVSGQLPAGVTGVSIDTRTLAPGDLFVAIRGETHDGHAYVPQAFEKGAAACVVEEGRIDAPAASGPLFIVKDAQAAMERLGRASRQRSRAWIAAVTGSVGKTSTKEALRLVLSRFGQTHAAVASYNNHWGVPLTLARMPAEATFGVFEIGMNHAGEIRPLVEMVRPHVALVTTVAPVHLENLGTLAAIAQEKGDIYSGLEPDGVAIMNADAPHLDLLVAAARRANAGRVYSFGQSAHADMQLVSVEPDGAGSAVVASFQGRLLRFRLGAPGKHLAMNALAVLLAAQAMGCDLEDAADALAGFSAPAGRGEQSRLRTKGGEFLLIDEAYNANPASMRAALAVLAAAPLGKGGRRIAVLGDMLELGADAAKLHAELAGPISDARVDLVYAAGPLMKSLFEALPPERKGLWAETSAAIESALPSDIRAGDAVMVKGSNGSRMGPVVAAIRKQAASQPAEEV